MKEQKINASEYRYERKFFITSLSKYEVESIVKLHPAIFQEIYERRFVNNIYFDSYDLDSYHENVEGTKNRIKVRVRWYGDLFGFVEKPVLEIKIKNGLLGKKNSFPIAPFDLTRNYNICDMLKPFFNEVLEIDLRDITPSLLNRYSRKYYQSSDRIYRVTIDSEQSFYLINKENNLFLNSHNDYDSVILELKYNQEYNSGANHITSTFPFRVTKSSKYVSGVQKIMQVFS